MQPYYLRRHMKVHKEVEAGRASFSFLEGETTGSDQQCGLRTRACSLCSVTCKGTKELEEHVSKHFHYFHFHFLLDSQ